MEFQVEQFKVESLCQRGIWLVTTDSLIDLGMLFCRAQEFYESPSDKIRGKSFSIAEFMKYYVEKRSDSGTFSYFDDFRAYNVPKTSLDEFERVVIPDLNRNDLLFAKIVQSVRVLQGGDFYLIGAQTGHVPNTQHEVAHAMFYFMPEYRQKATALVEQMAKIEEIAYATSLMTLDTEGYTEGVWIDELQAYYATGLLGELEEFEHLREPFMKLFYQYKKKMMKKKSKKKPKVKPELKVPHIEHIEEPLFGGVAA